MANLQAQTTVICAELGEARRHAMQAAQRCCTRCRPLIQPFEVALRNAYIRAEGLDLQRSIRDYEDKHLPGAPLNQHLRQRRRDYLRLLDEYGGIGGEGKDKDRPMLLHQTAYLPKAG